MEDKDAKGQTLQALEMFIQTQRSLLARQKSDIELLEGLKLDVLDNTPLALESLNGQEEDALRLSAQPELRLQIPPRIDWKVFTGADTTSLRALLTKTKENEAGRRTPSLTQTSPLSELQLLVKQARKLIVDPVLASVAQSPIFLLPDIAEPEEDDDLEVSRQKEREKILELKKRKVTRRGGGLSLRRLCNNVVFVRDDDVDESMDVDIGYGGGISGGMPDMVIPGSRPFSSDADTAIRPKKSTLPVTSTRRARKPTVKLRLTNAEDIPSLPPKKAKSSANVKTYKVRQLGECNGTLDNTFENQNDAAADDSEGKQSSSLAPAKKKSETYKQAWSMEEQNLLEQLLEKFPEGEKNRWLQISKAMGGRRTPRQVASRVQKYFEKLRKYGLVE